ncbi:MAG: capsular biosynthesis protein [Hyphomicrobiales bacterium]|nr:capsular biosynthesis protein [Hyphomicrobiales bacterium]
MKSLPADADGGSTLPALAPSAGRAIETHQRGYLAHDFEEHESQLRATLLHYVGLAFKHRMLIAYFCGVALIGGFVTTMLTTRIYSASAVVKIDRASPKVVNNQVTQSEGAADPQFYQTQYELIKSRSLAERVVTNLNLAQTDFLGGASRSLLSRIFAGGGETGDPESVRGPEEIQARKRDAIENVMDNLTVQPVALSSLVRIRFSSPSPLWAQRISLAVAENYERSTLDRRFGASKHARDFLEERLQQLKLKLQDSEQQLIEYAQKQGIVMTDDKQPQVSTSLQAVQVALAAAVMERIRNEQMWLQAQGTNGMELPQVMNDKIIQSSRERLAALQATYQDKLNLMKPAFPEMLALRAQIGELERQIRNQIALIKESIKSQFDNARAQETALIEKLDEVKAEALEVRGRSIEYTILLREVDTARSLYEGLLQQFRELGVAGDVDTNNISIIDRPEVPLLPDSPSLRKNLLAALLLSLLAAAGVIAVREALDDTFKSVEDMEAGLRLPVLGVTPMLSGVAAESTPVMEVLTDVTSPMAEAYRSLRTALQFSTEDGAPKSLLVTSARPGEGKSTTSVCLAANFAQLGMRVLLVDGDLRNPSVHKILAADNSAGLSNYLAGSADASGLVKSSSIKGVTLMTTGPLPPNPAELLAGPRFLSLLATASETFDVVIIDGPPVMGLADAPIIASVTGGTLLVVQAAGTRRAVVRDAVKRLDFARARLLGTLLSKFDPAKAGHSYGYGYGYGYGYSYGSKDYYTYGGGQKPALGNK